MRRINFSKENLNRHIASIFLKNNKMYKTVINYQETLGLFNICGIDYFRHCKNFFIRTTDRTRDSSSVPDLGFGFLKNQSIS